MRTIFSFPGNMADAQMNARALYEASALVAYVTTFSWQEKGRFARVIKKAPKILYESILKNLERRSIKQIDSSFLRTHPQWEIARTLAARLPCGLVLSDFVWDHSSQDFDRWVARRWVSQAEAIEAYEYTALSSFRRGKNDGIARILHVVSLDNEHAEELTRRERDAWPEMAGRYTRYFDSKFARRLERRREEIALADVIIANSSLTARSHILAGADPKKVFAVPLGAPRPVDGATIEADRTKKPLVALWAGNFSIGKGAHYAMRAWQMLNAGNAAKFEVYGQLALPSQFLVGLSDTISFHGSVPQAELFKAYRNADVLVFPTLMDGFGMVVTEALAHGVPVITTEQAGAAELITPENGLIVPTANPKALADALRWCLDNRRHLAEMRHAALETARRRQWSDYRRDLIAALDQGTRYAGYRPSYRAL